MNSNYSVWEQADKSWLCVVVTQDDTERWVEPALEQAKHAVVRCARVLNGTYIRHDEIDVHYQTEKPAIATKAMNVTDEELLNDIKSGKLVVLPYDDLRIKYRITNEECCLIVDIREGTRKVVNA